MEDEGAGAIAAGGEAGACMVSGFELPGVVLGRGKDGPVTGGHTLIYSGAVDRVLALDGESDAGFLEAGALVNVYDSQMAHVAVGTWNPWSQYKVRVLVSRRDAALWESMVPPPEAGAAALTRGVTVWGEHELVAHVVGARVAAAAGLRRRLGLGMGGTDEGAGEAWTTACRLINSDGDGVCGVSVDLYNQTAVVRSSALWAERHREAIEVAVLAHGPGVLRVLWRQDLPALRADLFEYLRDGLDGPWEGDSGESCAVSRRVAEAVKHGAARPDEEGDEVPGAGDGATELVAEHGVRYEVSLAEGAQKTGFYCDQRENRQVVRSLVASVVAAQGTCAVLDLCCYTGGFAINAALAGATRVVGVDSSAPALNFARRNAALNGVADRVEFVHGDIAKVMAEALRHGERFDVVVLDPPKLAPSRKDLDGALQKYRRLNCAAMRLAPDAGGFLATFSCSGAVAADRGHLFGIMLREASLAVGRPTTILREGGPAPDHPYSPSVPEGRYLTFRLLAVS